MSTEQSRGHQGHDSDVSAQDWEDLARRLIAERIFSDQQELDDALGQLKQMVQDGEVTPEAIREFRDAFYTVQRRIEDDLAPIVDGIEPYGRVGVNLNFKQREELLTKPWKTEPVDEGDFTFNTEQEDEIEEGAG